MLYGVTYFAGGTVAAVGDTEVWVVKPGGTLFEKHTYDGLEPNGFAFSGSSIGIVLRHSGATEGGRLMVVNASGDLAYTAEFGGAYRHLSPHESGFWLLTSSALHHACLLYTSYKEENDTTVLLVSHSMEDVARVAKRVLVMNGGQIAMFAPTAEVFSRAEELESIGLSIPAVTKVFMRLREKGDVYKRQLETRLFPRFGGAAFSDEIGLPVTDGGFSPRRVLPCGATAPVSYTHLPPPAPPPAYRRRCGCLCQYGTDL